MSAQEKIAKSGLKKSLIFGGSITAVTAGVGLAVSIPVYFDIQKQLKNQIDQTVNLAKYITDLTSKLGVSPDAEFIQELEGGYTMLVKNGQTQIYQSTAGGGKVLIMNTNADGSVSSASSLQGPSAQQMINVLRSAGEELGENTEEMEEIMRGYVEETERASRETEALMLGVDYEVLVIRDILSNFKEGSERDAALAEELEIANRERRSNLEQDYTNAEWDALVQKALDLKAAEAQARIDMEEQLEDVKNGAEVHFTDETFNQMVQNTQDPTIQGELQAIQQQSEQRMNDANQKANEAYATASFERVENSVNGNASPALVSVAKNPASWMNMFVKAMGGASFDRGRYVENETNTLLMQSLYHTLIQQGLAEENFDDIVNIIGHDILEIPSAVHITIENSELHDEIEQHGAVTFTELINTYTYTDESGKEVLNTNELTNRLFILKVTIKDQKPDGTFSIENGLLVARSSERNLIDFENMVYISPDSEEKIKTINYLIQAATLGVDTELPGGIKLENEILGALVALAEGRIDNSDIPILEPASEQSFNEYMKISEFIQSQSDEVASHLSVNLIHELLRYLLGSYEKTNTIPAHYTFPDKGDMYDISYESYVKAYNALISLTGVDVFSSQSPTSSNAYEIKDKLWLDIFDMIIDPVTTTTDSNGNVVTRGARSAQLSSRELNKIAQLDRYTELINIIETYKDNVIYIPLITYINSLEAIEVYNKIIMTSVPMNTIKVNFALLENLIPNLPNYDSISLELVFNLLVSDNQNISLILSTYDDLLTLNSIFTNYNDLVLPTTGASQNAILTELDEKVNQLIRLESGIKRFGGYVDSLDIATLYNDLIINDQRADVALFTTHINQILAAKNLDNFDQISLQLIWELLVSNSQDVAQILETYNNLLTLNPALTNYRKLELPSGGSSTSQILDELNDKIEQLIRLETAVPRLGTYFESLSISTIYSELLSNTQRPNVALFTKHIDEIIDVSLNPGFDAVTAQMLWQLVNSNEPTLEFILANYMRIFSTPGLPADFDINSPVVQEKINAASGVSESLASTHSGVTGSMTTAQLQQITKDLDAVITISSSLTPEQFGWIVEYTNTVFDVFTNIDDVYEQLHKVLNAFGSDATRNTEIVNNIHTFNGWITTIKQQHPGQQVTVDMIKNYVWTQNIHAETYVGTNVNSGSLVDGPITGASVGDWVDPRNHDLGRRVYVMGHTDSQRQLSILTPGGTTTTVVKANLYNDQSGTIINSSGNGGNHMSAMSRFIEDTNQSDDIVGYFYYVSLWDQYFYYKITIHQTSTGSDTYEITKVPFTGDKWTSGARNVAVTPDGKYMFVFVDQSQSIYRIDLSTGVSTALNASVIGNLGYGATAFEYNGANYLVASSGTVGGQQFVNVYTVSSDGAINKVDSIEVTSRLTTDTNQQISAFAIGDPIGTTIPIFAQGLTGDLIQVIFDTATNRFVAGETFTLLTAARTQQLSGTSAQHWRGMVYNGGAITIYGATRAIYIADQSNNLNDIFNLLMVH